MSTAIVSLVAAILAAVASVVTVVISTRSQRRLARETAERAADERAQTLLDRYQEPLLRAAYDLQSRLFNILERRLLDVSPNRRGYVESSTVCLLG